MNRHLLLWLTAIVLLATTGCRPRHPPHTPQPFGMEAATSDFDLAKESRDYGRERFLADRG